jgi:hypothetical protein
MKINPLDKQQLIQTQGKPGTQKAGGQAFNKIFESKLNTSSAEGMDPGSKTAPPIRPNLHQSMDVKLQAYAKLEQMFDHLDRYQNLLSDGQASLKAVAPSMGSLKEDLGEIEALMENINDEDPLKNLLQESLVTVSKEVYRFESGAYVDR